MQGTSHNNILEESYLSIKDVYLFGKNLIVSTFPNLINSIRYSNSQTSFSSKPFFSLINQLFSIFFLMPIRKIIPLQILLRLAQTKKILFIDSSLSHKQHALLSIRPNSNNLFSMGSFPFSIIQE